MTPADLGRLLDTALHDTRNRISLTVTDLPARELHLRELVEGAFGAGVRNGLPLSEVQISLDRFPSLARWFSDAPVTESGDPGVLRLIYDPLESSSAGAAS